ncbi:unnamed protein product [Caenorhabditis bovis]|uniref:Uncharacterized protein n=1 Tax=Caenorhabditis bovis TaxID=2654633 RepID=A0A8S1FD30_9PELO|nr:unnamed protein product [Caenorhabditis bovis]
MCSKTLQNDVGRVATDTSHIRTKTVELAMEVAEMRRALGREKQAHQDVLLMLQQLREKHVTLNKQLAAVLASAASEPKVTIGGAGKPEKVITCTLCSEEHKEELCQRFPTATDRLLKAIEAELYLKCARHPARVKCRHQRLKCPRCGSEAHLQIKVINSNVLLIRLNLKGNDEVVDEPHKKGLTLIVQTGGEKLTNDNWMLILKLWVELRPP